MDIIHQPHDKLFERVFRVQENAVNLLQNTLPASIQSHLDLNGLYFEESSFVPKHLQAYYSDMVASVPVIDGEQHATVYFLFEHKSARYPYTSFQLLRYMIEMWDQFLLTREDPDQKLPVIIPVVVAHPKSAGKRKYISQLVHLPSGEFKAYVPDFEYMFYNPVTEDPEDHDFNLQVKALMTIWRYSHSPGFQDGLRRAFQLIRQIDPEVKMRDFLLLVASYLHSVRKDYEWEDIEKIVKEEIPKGEEYMGTIAEMFERRGLEKGREEGIMLGEQRGQLKSAQEMLIEIARDKYGSLPVTLENDILSIQSVSTLKHLGRQLMKLDNQNDFAGLVKKALE